VKGAFCEIRQFGKLGALRLTLARENGIDYMINKVIVESLSFTLNALSRKPNLSGMAQLLLLSVAHAMLTRFNFGSKKA
jgi:hypothetical protein